MVLQSDPYLGFPVYETLAHTLRSTTMNKEDICRDAHFLLRQGLTVYPWQASHENLISLLSARTAGMHNHAWPQFSL